VNSENENGQVAILIDFENLVRGASNQETIDCELIFKLAEEYGRVLMANAYADWRMKDVNQYQTDLYRLGIELVHVFGKYGGDVFKNAVDVKIAVDAISATSSLPHINVFVIVSGDRDFIPVIKALRRQGKTVIGVSPAMATSDDFAALCDRFIQYESLVATYENQKTQRNQMPESERLADVRRVLQEIMSENPNGIKGALIKPGIRQKLSPTFDESAFGFAKLIDLLRYLSDVVRIDVPERGGDITVFPASSEVKDRDSKPLSNSFYKIKSAANLSLYRYEQNCEKRRHILSMLFNIMAGKGVFSLLDVEREALEQESKSGIPLTVTILSGYWSILYQNRGFVFEPNQDNMIHRERLCRLKENINSSESLIRVYENAITYKVMAAMQSERSLLPEELCEILGLSKEDSDNLDCCMQLMHESKHMLDNQMPESVT